MYQVNSTPMKGTANFAKVKLYEEQEESRKTLKESRVSSRGNEPVAPFNENSQPAEKERSSSGKKQSRQNADPAKKPPSRQASQEKIKQMAQPVEYQSFSDLFIIMEQKGHRPSTVLLEQMIASLTLQLDKL